MQPIVNRLAEEISIDRLEPGTRVYGFNQQVFRDLTASQDQVHFCRVRAGSQLFLILGQSDLKKQLPVPP